MILVVMVAYDKKAQAYMTPFFVNNQQLGIRAFKDACNNAESPICRNPEDFSLFRLGTFDDNTGAMKLSDVPEPVVEAINLKKGAV